MRVWHDDIRRPPDDSWCWARTNEQAVALLLVHEVDEISIDHDLGLEHVDPEFPGAITLAGVSPNGTGMDLAVWMVENDCVPEQVTIHSWNPVGAQAIARVLNDAGYNCTISPFQPR